ncbi:hypothetical protein BU24DRAFT_408373 [Aaosphaeria arxii CBS 175.79]|uniref:Polynucleotide 5'-hydroxyl-kinase GRC3 n=1 Tax=Aaosphaeria arxii CBS 175.79 TaxID=1450172 RepID=A0A6A5XZS2_9PLEO|nr:uncharacterized protein BU24DRAFT_408373 [Aaosphaeria arxii CBS 175.79]KAF2018466.1 hypothetical protein BU24DRAFT_408373 [Aaosphaeria arxii CBS 175.79]
MPEKRKRNNDSVSAQGTGEDNVKPMSAVAAAKLRALQPEIADAVQESIDISPSPLVDPEPSDFDDNESSTSDDGLRSVQLCTWRYGQDHISSETESELTVFLQRNATISMIGCFDLVVLRGAINVNGANLSATGKEVPQVHRIYVPSISPITVIRGLDTRNEVRFLDCEEAVPLSDLSPLFANIWNASTSLKNRKRSFSLITDSDADPWNRPIAPELAPEDWLRQIEECANNPSTILVGGMPTSGKSMFARRLINRCLTGLGKSARAMSAVYFLDLDPNKPEYGPHGQISLALICELNLGPSFTRPSPENESSENFNKILHAHSVPTNDLFNYWSYFIACVKHLFRVYTDAQRQQPAPLIVNTPGSIFSIDVTLFIDVLAQIKPRQVVLTGDLEAIDELNAARLDAVDTFSRKSGITVSHIPAQYSVNKLSHSEAQLRSMHMLSYFHCTGRSQSDPRQFTFNSKSISSMTPWEFCYEETSYAQQTFIGILSMGEYIEPSRLSHVLNGSLVKLVETEDESIIALSNKLPRTQKYRLPYFQGNSDGMVAPPEPATSRVVCTALLRAWDPENRIAQLLIPKSLERAIRRLNPEKTVLISGCCDHPEWAYTEHDYYRLLRREDQVSATTTVLQQSQSPWVMPASTIKNMGYMNTTRRVRKFQQ